MYSYSYDLTRTLQYNMSPPNFVGATANIEEDTPLPDWNKVCIFDISKKSKCKKVSFCNVHRKTQIQKNTLNMHFVVYHENVLYGMHFY